MSTPGPAGSGPAAHGEHAGAAVVLGSPLAAVIGGRSARLLHKAFGFETVRDLVTHYPRRYASRGELSPLTGLPVGEAVTVVAEVREAREHRMRSRRGSILDVRISDGHGSMTLTFFNQGWRAKELTPGVRGMFAGKVSAYRGRLQLAHPDYELFEPAEPDVPRDAAAQWAGTPIPVYAATSSVASWQIQRAVGVVLDALATSRIPEPVPEQIRRRGMLGFAQALEKIHRPRTDDEWHQARRTLRRVEAIVLQAALLQQRAGADALPAVARRAKPGGFLERFDAALGFPLTADQRAVGERIAADLARPHPMRLLLQGDVGSGKTLVALRAMLLVADSGGQCVLAAPTEILATQHLYSVTAMLGPDLAGELVPTLLTGSLGAGARRSALLRIASGRARIVIGTHALFGEAVTFDDLAFVVIDEQHRFGVEQRDVLRTKSPAEPHTLVMTATPIPRTIAMTVFGDLDVATLRTMPPGRRPVQTITVPLAEHPGWADRVWTRSAEEIAAGRQVFMVCPAIDETSRGSAGRGTDADLPAPFEADAVLFGDAAASAGEGAEQAGTAGAGPAGEAAWASVDWAERTARAHPSLQTARIAVVHGRLPADEKNRVMRDFAAGAVDLLIATTVVEVGVDVPNASLMVIFDADRFGLSQLHQLRGRVGRGTLPGLCLLVTHAPAGTAGRERVDAAAGAPDGFALAQIDLELRREGDVLGSSQSGRRSSLRLLRVTRDAEVIAQSRDDAREVLHAPGGLAAHPALERAVRERLDDVERDFLARN